MNKQLSQNPLSVYYSILRQRTRRGDTYACRQRQGTAIDHEWMII